MAEKNLVSVCQLVLNRWVLELAMDKKRLVLLKQTLLERLSSELAQRNCGQEDAVLYLKLGQV